MKRNVRLKILIFLAVLSLPILCNAQIYAGESGVILPTVDLYDTQLMIESIRTARQFSERAEKIREKVQPYRTRQYQCYLDGQYREAVEICRDVRREFVHYKYDNKAISDMEKLAGDCAVIIEDYETAISFYQIALQAGENGIDLKLSNVFDLVIKKARIANDNRDYSMLWYYVNIASKTGFESGELYYYYGVYYENGCNYKEAKKMYKKAKKKDYAPAITALKELNKKY